MKITHSFIVTIFYEFFASTFALLLQVRASQLARSIAHAHWLRSVFRALFGTRGFRALKIISLASPSIGERRGFASRRIRLKFDSGFRFVSI